MWYNEEFPLNHKWKYCPHQWKNDGDQFLEKQKRIIFMLIWWSKDIQQLLTIIPQSLIRLLDGFAPHKLILRGKKKFNNASQRSRSFK